jgi:hypothetical protein
MIQGHEKLNSHLKLLQRFVGYIRGRQVDEDIPTKLLPPSLQDEDEAAVKLKFNKVRIGSITRAH